MAGAHWLRLPLAYAGFVLIGLGGGATGVLLPAQTREYGLTKSVIGLLFFAFSVGYVAAGAVTGWLLRRLGLRGSLVLGGAAFAVSALACGARPAYPALLALVAVLAFGSGALDACLNAYLSGQPGSTAKLNLLHGFYGVGALIGPVLAALVLDTGYPWGVVYLVFAVFAAPLVVGFAAGFPRDWAPSGADPVLAGDSAGAGAGSGAAAPAEAQRAERTPGPAEAQRAERTPGPAEAQRAERTPGPARAPGAFRAAARHPAIVRSALFLAVYIGVEVSLGNWTYSFLIEERGQGTLLAGWVVSGYWFGLTAGRFLMSAVARLRLEPVTLTYGCLAALLGAATLTWLVPGTAAAVVGFILLGVFLGPVFPLTIAVLPRLAPGWLVPTAIGLLVGVGVAAGAFFPWLAGALAQRVGLTALFPFVLVLCIALLATWWRIARRITPSRPGEIAALGTSSQ